MYNVTSSIPEFGRSLAVKHGCSIELSMPADQPPLFTIGSKSNSFEFCFEHTALRTFVRLGEEALTKLIATNIQHTDADHGHDESHQGVGNMRHLSWVWISGSCPMEYVITSQAAMFFRIGPASNRFEPTFDAEALRSFVQLARQALAMIDRQEDPEARGELVFAGSQQPVSAGQR